MSKLAGVLFSVAGFGLLLPSAVAAQFHCGVCDLDCGGGHAFYERPWSGNAQGNAHGCGNQENCDMHPITECGLIFTLNYDAD